MTTTIRFEQPLPKTGLDAVPPTEFPGVPAFLGSWVVMTTADGTRVALPEGRIRSITWTEDEDEEAELVEDPEEPEVAPTAFPAKPGTISTVAFGFAPYEPVQRAWGEIPR